MWLVHRCAEKRTNIVHGRSGQRVGSAVCSAALPTPSHQCDMVRGHVLSNPSHPYHCAVGACTGPVRRRTDLFAPVTSICT